MWSQLVNVTKIGPDLRSPWLSRARDLSRDHKFSNPTNTTVCPRSSTQGTFRSIETSPLRNVPRFQAMSVFDTIVEKISGD